MREANSGFHQGQNLAPFACIKVYSSTQTYRVTPEAHTEWAFAAMERASSFSPRQARHLLNTSYRSIATVQHPIGGHFMRANKSIHDIAIQTFRPWDDAQLTTLLAAQRERRLITVRTAAAERELHFLLLGFDHTSGELLISQAFPDLSQAGIHRMAQYPCWLQLEYRGTCLHIQAKVTKICGDLITLKTIFCQFSDNRRWQPRIEFEERMGPSATLLGKHLPEMKGSVKDLSPLGAALEFFGFDGRQSLRAASKFHCILNFNEQFCPHIPVRIKQLIFLRVPSRTRVRMIFDQSYKLEQSQILEFIEAVQSTSLAA